MPQAAGTYNPINSDGYGFATGCAVQNPEHSWRNRFGKLDGKIQRSPNRPYALIQYWRAMVTR
jgi:hypothetical protein